jgi:D-alanine-D-alanine ligase
MIDQFKDKIIGIFYGGNSQERKISIKSGQNVKEALTKLGYKTKKIDPATDSYSNKTIDIAFLCLHGPGYEDGKIQEILENKKIPYTGCGITASQIGMSKLKTKKLCTKHTLPTPNYIIANSLLATLPNPFKFPVIMKPISEGSSIDVFLAETPSELKSFSTKLAKKYPSFILEEFIEGKEITIGIVETNKLIALPSLEIKTTKRFLDYEAKYTKGFTEFVLPAQISREITEKLNTIALKLFQKCECNGVARVDFRLSNSNDPFILEINTIPGLTKMSDLPAQAKEFGWSFEFLIEAILSSAIKRYNL